MFGQLHADTGGRRTTISMSQGRVWQARYKGEMNAPGSVAMRAAAWPAKSRAVAAKRKALRLKSMVN